MSGSEPQILEIPQFTSTEDHKISWADAKIQIKEKMKADDISIGKLADLIDSSYPVVTNALNKGKSPQGATIFKFQKFLGKSIDGAKEPTKEIVAKPTAAKTAAKSKPAAKKIATGNNDALKAEFVRLKKAVDAGVLDLIDVKKFPNLSAIFKS